MHLPALIQLSSAAASPELVAAINAASPGTAFAVELGDGRTALLTLAAMQTAPGRGGMPPHEAAAVIYPPRSYISERKSKRLPLEAFFSKITERLETGRARSVHNAAIQIVSEYPVGRGGTPESRAHYLGRKYRLAASAFFQENLSNSKDLPAAAWDDCASKFENQKENECTKQTTPSPPASLLASSRAAGSSTCGAKVSATHNRRNLAASLLGQRLSQSCSTPILSRSSGATLSVLDILHHALSRTTLSSRFPTSPQLGMPVPPHPASCQQAGRTQGAA